VSKQSGDASKELRAQQKERYAKVWQLIKESGVKRRWVAMHLGVSYGYLNQVQYGHAPMTAEMRRRLSEYLGLSEAELFGSEK
jgi:transcriptional regulator with XRE-family HTH domain